MGTPYLGEIRMFAGNFAPRGYALCDGQLLTVSQYDALFSLLGTIYGGDGRTTFGLPDLRGRIPIHQGTGPGLTQRRIGTRAGIENVTLIANQIPQHAHTLAGNNQSSDQGNPNGKVPGQSTVNVYTSSPTDTAIRPLNDGSIAAAGGNKPHTNLMPFLCINFIIALTGVYPSRN